MLASTMHTWGRAERGAPNAEDLTWSGECTPRDGDS